MQTEATILSFDRLEISGTLVPKSLGGEADVSLTVQSQTDGLSQASSYAILLSPINSNSTERIELVSTMSSEPNLSNMNHVPWKKRYQLRLSSNDGKYLILHLVDETQFQRWHFMIREVIANIIFFKAFTVSSSSHCVSTTRIQSGIHRCEDILIPSHHPLMVYAKRVLTIKAVTHSLLARLAHDPKQVLRNEVTGILRGIDEESSKFNGLGYELKFGIQTNVVAGSGSGIGSGVELSRWGVYLHGASLLQEDHEINMLRKLEPCLFTQEELNRHQRREINSGTCPPSQSQESQERQTIDNDMENDPAKIDDVAENNSLHRNTDTHNDHDKDTPSIHPDTEVPCDMERVVRHVLTQPPESLSERAFATSPTIPTHQPTSSIFNLPSLNAVNAAIPGLPSMKKSATAVLSSAMSTLSNISSPVKSERAQQNISVKSELVTSTGFSNKTSPLSSPVKSTSQTSARSLVKSPSRFLPLSSQISIMSAATNAVSSAKDTLTNTATRVRASATQVSEQIDRVLDLAAMAFIGSTLNHQTTSSQKINSSYYSNRDNDLSIKATMEISPTSGQSSPTPNQTNIQSSEILRHYESNPDWVEDENNREDENKEENGDYEEVSKGLEGKEGTVMHHCEKSEYDYDLASLPTHFVCIDMTVIPSTDKESDNDSLSNRTAPSQIVQSNRRDHPSQILSFNSPRSISVLDRIQYESTDSTSPVHSSMIDCRSRSISSTSGSGNSRSSSKSTDVDTYIDSDDSHNHAKIRVRSSTRTRKEMKKVPSQLTHVPSPKLTTVCCTCPMMAVMMVMILGLTAMVLVGVMVVQWDIVNPPHQQQILLHPHRPQQQQPMNLHTSNREYGTIKVCVFREEMVINGVIRKEVLRQHVWVKLGVLKVHEEGVLKECMRNDLKDVLQHVLMSVLRRGMAGVRLGRGVVQSILSHAAEDFGGSSMASVGLG